MRGDAPVEYLNKMGYDAIEKVKEKYVKYIFYSLRTVAN